MSDLFFYLSKIFWILAQPDHFLLLLLLLGLLQIRRRVGKLLVTLVLVSFISVAMFPMGNLLLQPLESQFPQPQLPTQINGVIVLGGGEDAELTALHGQASFGDGAERLMVVPELLHRYPNAKVIFTGGSGSVLRPDYRGGDVAHKWLAAQGIEEQVIIERDSRNTFQNALLTRELLREMNLPEENWLLVTSAFHMPRSMGVFRHAGLEPIAYPVDYRAAENRFRPNLTRNMQELNTAVREWIGLYVYYFTGKTPVLLPAPAQETESARQP